MICHMPFLVTLGDCPDSVMKAASVAIAHYWGAPLLEVPFRENPNEFMKSLWKEKGLVRILGDVGILTNEAGSWLEILGAWKCPVIFLVSPLPNGDIPGLVAAYVALSKALSVEMIGIVQVGDAWNYKLRKMDGLPWCGWMPSINKPDIEALAKNNPENDLIIENLVHQLKKRVSSIN